MKDSTLNVPKNNTFEFTVEVEGLSDLTGYTATLTVKKKLKGDLVFSVESTDFTDNIMIISVPATNNNIAAGAYVYGINLSDGTNNYTLDLGDGDIPEVVGIYNILSTVKDS